MRPCTLIFGAYRGRCVLLQLKQTPKLLNQKHNYIILINENSDFINIENLRKPS